MKIIISDTGPILHLHEIKALFLLSKAGEVMIPPAVDEELSAKIPLWSRQRPSWLEVRSLTEHEKEDASLWLKSGDLDAGEAEAIAMARDIHPDWLLTDDASARVFATLMGFEVHGSLGVILWGTVTGQTTREEAEIFLDGLSRSSLWISESVLMDARKMLDEILKKDSSR